MFSRAKFHYYCIIISRVIKEVGGGARRFKRFHVNRDKRHMGTSLYKPLRYRKLIFFYKIINDLSPDYLKSYISVSLKKGCQTRSANKNVVKPLPVRTISFQYSYFPYCINQWNRLSDEIKNVNSINKFKKSILSFIKVKENSIFNVHDPVGIKLLTRLRLKFSHLNEHKFRHNFRDTVNSMCACGAGIETTCHFFLRCQFFISHRTKLLNSVFKNDPSIQKLSDDNLVNLLLYGSENFDFKINQNILYLTITYIKATGRFDEPLLLNN